MGKFNKLICFIKKEHAEARFIMLPEYFGLYRYSSIECRRCGKTLEKGYKPSEEEIAAYNVWALNPTEEENGTLT